MTHQSHPSNYGPASAWARLDVADALAGLASRRDGLTHAEVQERRERYGPNQLPRAARTPWYVRLGHHFVQLFAVLLYAAAALAWLAAMPELSVAILVVIVVNGLFGFWQEHQAERATEALEALLPHRVTARRDGRIEDVSAAEVVPGDVLVVSEGALVPADCRLLSVERLRVDLASLTGESHPVAGSAAAELGGASSLAAQRNLLFAGTAVVSGRAEAVVFATGGHTEFAKIALLSQSERERPSPLELEVRKLTRVITVLALCLGAGFYLAGTALGGLSPAASFVFALGVIVANVPEGLLPTLTLSLALAVRRMATHNALVKRLSAVEALGAATVILTDKTGTLTENEMTVRELWLGGQSFRVTGRGDTLDGALESGRGADTKSARSMLEAAAACCDAFVARTSDGRGLDRHGDPTEAALMVAALKAGSSTFEHQRTERLAELPFDSDRKRMSVARRIGQAVRVFVKGAPGAVLSVSTHVERNGGRLELTESLSAEVERAHRELAARGYRVLAIATRDVPESLLGSAEWQPNTVERELTLLGFVAMEDPPRPEVPEAIRACRRAGVRVVMMTGDSGLTGASIGRQIGLYDGRERVIGGGELDQLSEVALDALLGSEQLLFCRTSPEHKLRLVKAFQRRGDVVAVTGDGVNDGPALKRADIGVAMGQTGTDVARAAADVILKDDNFASIVTAIAEGRVVYDNVRKFVTYILASNVPELVPFAAFVLLGVPLPLTVMQILAVDLGTDLLPALALGAEAPDPDVMQRPPRSRSERLLSAATLLRAYGWLGAGEAALAMLAFYYAYWQAGYSPSSELPSSGPVYVTATTMTFAAIVCCQIGNLLACRSRGRSAFRRSGSSNALLVPALAFEIALLSIFLYVPKVAQTFGFGPLGLEHWALLLVFPPALLAFETLRKLAARAFFRIDPRGLNPFIRRGSGIRRAA